MFHGDTQVILCQTISVIRSFEIYSLYKRLFSARLLQFSLLWYQLSVNQETTTSAKFCCEISQIQNSSLSLENVFRNFHWLRGNERILFKLLLTVHKCINHTAPHSLCALITFGDSERTKKLHETKVKTKYGERDFSHAGPKLWNLLPISIRSEEDTVKFKSSLKSFLMFNGPEFTEKIKIH